MPIFELSKVLGVGRSVKVFFSLYGGATRGEVPEFPKQLRHLVKKQRGILKKQRGILKDKNRQIAREHRRFVNKRNTIRRQRVEIFRLMNELQAVNEPTEDAVSVPHAPEVGALPDFVIIGAQKCGTTRFYHLLVRHPNVAAGALKEVHFFDQPKNLQKGVEWYRRLFLKPTNVDGHRTITGEKTPNYLFDPDVPERMAGVIPDARLIVLLRNPVDRAYSHYRHVTRGGREKRGFEEIIDAELAWLAKHAGLPENPVSNSGRNGSPGLLSRGIYVDQLARWRRFFDEGQMLVIKSEDFYARQAKTLKQVQGFFGLPSHEIATRSRTSRVHYEPMDQALRNRLEAFFEPHNSRLYDYLGRDFGW